MSEDGRAAAIRRPDDPQPPELWAVHVIGMDDLHACASRSLAVRNATWMNLSAISTIPDLADPLYPLSYAVPSRWPFSAESHAAALAREETEDGRWSDTEADVLGDLMRSAQAAP